VDSRNFIVFNQGIANAAMEIAVKRALPTLLISLNLLLPQARAEGYMSADRDTPYTLAAGRTCKQVTNCREAVELWCSGYRRADADSDGIPCENICHSREQVDEIRRAIGC